MSSDDGFTHAEEVLARPEPTPDPEPVISKELKKEGGAADKGGADKLKATLLISGAVVAVIGAIFAIAKKIKEA
ncbi:hypothetical protein AAHA92_21348 [Salvia divinorum]|uniref:Uncharacterized protein n=1 Tax=Salvia divinorum TaxID=28513 RepID=A0ABD1GK59_SALDI